MGTRCTLRRPGLVPYQQAWQLQQRLADSVRIGGDPALVLLQHPPTYTLGVRARRSNVLVPESALLARGASLEVTDRGGDVTFHGPGQLVGYPILDLPRFGFGAADYVRNLQDTLIDALAAFHIEAGCYPKRPGVWVGNAKIAAIGVRISRGITTHGFALNVNTDLTWFDAIVPCGYTDTGVTSMQRLTGAPVDMDRVAGEVAAAFVRHFGADLYEESLAEAAHGR